MTKYCLKYEVEMMIKSYNRLFNRDSSKMIAVEKILNEGGWWKSF
jgi:hypothetical protein